MCLRWLVGWLQYWLNGVRSYAGYPIRNNRTPGDLRARKFLSRWRSRWAACMVTYAYATSPPRRDAYEGGSFLVAVGGVLGGGRGGQVWVPFVLGCPPTRSPRADARFPPRHSKASFWCHIPPPLWVMFRGAIWSPKAAPKITDLVAQVDTNTVPVLVLKSGTGIGTAFRPRY